MEGFFTANFSACFGLFWHVSIYLLFDFCYSIYFVSKLVIKVVIKLMSNKFGNRLVPNLFDIVQVTRMPTASGDGHP
jgi:hypothetical protein